MSTHWKDAAASYRVAQEAQALASAEVEKLEREDMDEFVRGVKELEQFIASGEGVQALALLRASGHQVIFAKNKEDESVCILYYMDGSGLRQSMKTSDPGLGFIHETPLGKVTPIYPYVAVEMAGRFAGKNPGEIVSWLRGEIDKIADAAPTLQSMAG